MNPSKKFGDIKHLGPVSKREMFLSKLERFSPYIHCFTIVIILFLVASAVSNLSKVRKIICAHTKEESEKKSHFPSLCMYFYINTSIEDSPFVQRVQRVV